MTTENPTKEIVRLDEARAARSENARDWTPLLALKDLAKKIEAGEIAPDVVYVAMREEQPDGMVRYDYSCAGGDDVHFVGLLTIHVHQLLSDD